jgi:hypothetical protein
MMLSLRIELKELHTSRPASATTGRGIGKQPDIYDKPPLLVVAVLYGQQQASV